MLAASSQPASPTPRTRARSTGAEVLSSPRRLDVEEDTDKTDERENMGEIGDKKGAFTEPRVRRRDGGRLADRIEALQEQ